MPFTNPQEKDTQETQHPHLSPLFPSASEVKSCKTAHHRSVWGAHACLQDCPSASIPSARIFGALWG